MLTFVDLPAVLDVEGVMKRDLKAFGTLFLIVLIPHIGEFLFGTPAVEIAAWMALMFVAWYAVFTVPQEVEKRLADRLITRALALSLDGNTAQRAADILKEDFEEELQSGDISDENYEATRIRAFIKLLSR